jgi:hypothetical protein
MRNDKEPTAAQQAIAPSLLALLLACALAGCSSEWPQSIN